MNEVFADERDTPLFLKITSTLAGYHGKRGEFAEAEALVREGLAAYADKPDNPAAIGKLHNLVILLKRQGKIDEAEPLFLEARERVTRVLGPEHQPPRLFHYLMSKKSIFEYYNARGEVMRW